MYKHAPKLMLVTALIALAAAGIFYARSSVRKSSPQSVSPTIRPHDTHTAEGIEGRVIDFEGQPIANAKVYADRDDVITLRLMSAISDEAGNFRIDVPEPGIYKVFGSKLEDGYPLTISGFHQEVKIYVPKVTVTDKQIARDVVVQFGPKGSKLDGLLVDAVTNRPITEATITFRRVDNPELTYIRGPAEAKEKGRFSDTVPAVPFTIEVSAEGYETEKTKALLVMRGEGKRVKIALHPKIQNAK